jgi:hypothetical protein
MAQAQGECEGVDRLAGLEGVQFQPGLEILQGFVLVIAEQVHFLQLDRLFSLARECAPRPTRWRCRAREKSAPPCLTAPVCSRNSRKLRPLGNFSLTPESSSTMISGATPRLVSSIAKAESTAAAGAQGTLMRRSVPPSVADRGGADNASQRTPESAGDMFASKQWFQTSRDGCLHLDACLLP